MKSIHLVSPGLYKVPIWLAPLLVSVSSITIKFGILAAWFAYNSSWCLLDAQIILATKIKFWKKVWILATSLDIAIRADCN